MRVLCYLESCTVKVMFCDLKFSPGIARYCDFYVTVIYGHVRYRGVQIPENTYR